MAQGGNRDGDDPRTDAADQLTRLSPRRFSPPHDGRGRAAHDLPLAVPSIASPGAMLAAVLLTENHLYGLGEQTQTTVVMLSVLLIALVFMLAASWIHRIIGDSGASVVSRVMGLLLAAVAATHVLSGITTYFRL